MSVAPKTSISHQGSGLGTRLVVELPEPLTEGGPEAIVRLMGRLPRRLRKLAPEQALREMINEVAVGLDLPSAAPVRQDVDVPPSRVRMCTDTVAIIAILAKSSDRLYLRDKEPVLSGVRNGRRIVLVLPDDPARSR